MRRSETNIANRIDVIDVLRGFALVGIFLRHFISRFDYRGNKYSHDEFLYRIDKLIEAADYHLLTDKTYPIFALLFGFSMFLVNQSSSSNGQLSLRSYKRLLGLVPFACLNAIFFPDGDILGLYVVVGLLVLLMVKLPLKWVPYLVVFFLSQPLVWIQMIIHLAGGNVNILNYHSSAFVMDVDNTIRSGNIPEIVWTNLTKGQIGNFLWALETGRVSQTIGLMLLGFYLGQSGRFMFFIENSRKNLRYLLIPVVVILGSWLFGKLNTELPVSKELALVLSNWSGLSFAFIYTIIILFIYNVFPAHYFSSLQFYGRMSLTNYVSQSVLGGILFAPFALNGVAYLSSSSIVFLFAIITFAQILLSK